MADTALSVSLGCALMQGNGRRGRIPGSRSWFRALPRRRRIAAFPLSRRIRTDS